MILLARGILNILKDREIIKEYNCYPFFFIFASYTKKQFKKENFLHVKKNPISRIEITRMKKGMTKHIGIHN
jgi:hypothetical protein